MLAAGFFADPPDAASASEDVRRMLAELQGQGAVVQIDETGVRIQIAARSATPERMRALRDRLVFVVARLGGRPLRRAVSSSQ